MYIFGMVPSSLHGGNPLEQFKINEYSAKIREDFAKGGLFEGLIEKHITNNRHYLKMHYSPDASISEKEEAAEKAKLDVIYAALSESQKSTIIEEAAALKNR